MGVCVWGAAQLLSGQLVSGVALPIRAGALAVVVGAGIVSFFGFAHITGAARLGALRAMLVRGNA